MTVENNSVKIKGLALLKFTTAPNLCERWQMIFIRAIFSPHSDDDRPVLQFHRIKMINRFKIAGALRLFDFLDVLFHTVHGSFDFDFLGQLSIEKVHASYA